MSLRRFSVRSEQEGFSVIEVLLAAAVFATLATGLIGAFVYGRQSTANTGDRGRAMELADEGVQAVRNIRDASYSNLAAGTYGLAQTGNVWTFSGSSDTTGMYTRQTTIAANGTNRFKITSMVTWPQAIGTTGSVSDTTELTNWASTLRTLSWLTPASYGTANYNAYKVATQGTYAYVVTNTSSSNFSIINTAATNAPSVISTLSITGNTTNVAVSGNYAYVSTSNSSGELVIINISNPAAPTVVGTYNAPGNASGLGVYVVGNYVYLSRAANGGNDELVIVNVTTPSSPTLVWGWNNNIALNEVYVSGTTIYLATSSTTKQVIALQPVLFGVTYTEVDLALTGTTAATTIAGLGSNLYVGQGTKFYIINGGLSGLLMSVYGSLTLPGTINDVDGNPNGLYVYAGTNNVSGEFQVINIASLTGPVLAGTVDVGGSSSVTGVSYNATQNIVVGVGTSTTQGTEVFGPN